MKKYFVKLYQAHDMYGPIDNSYTKNFELQYLWFSLYKPELNWIKVSKASDRVVVWNSDKTKPMGNIQFNTKQEMENWYKSYSEYSDKRWDDMPKLEMSLKNYEEILEKWAVIKKTKPTYIIFSQDDRGYVNLVGKAELSQEDLADMKLEHERYLKYDKAFKKYVSANPNRSEVWRSSEDSEFEADWQKYLED